MPSIPQSLLWISLVVLWLFVLVPMLINKRDTVRRTSDVALATRVLNGGRSRLLRRTGPATGHRHDPLWRDGEPGLDDGYEDASDLEPEDYEEAVRAAVREAESRKQSAPTPTMMVVAADSEAEATTEPVYIDVDVVDENSGALTVGATGVQESLFEEPSVGDSTDGGVQDAEVVEAASETPEVSEIQTRLEGDQEIGADEYEYVDDAGGLEPDEAVDPVVAARSKRRRMESTTAEAVSARKYRFRKRMLTAMAVVMVLTAVAAFTLSAAFWWACGAAATVMVLYLAYLRRQTRIEEQVRRRRQARMARSMGGRSDGYRDEDSAGYGARYDERAEEPDVTASRLRRPGAAVLDIDDEDPVFDHLDEVAYSRRYDLPRAAGQ